VHVLKGKGREWTDERELVFYIFIHFRLFDTQCLGDSSKTGVWLTKCDVHLRQNNRNLSSDIRVLSVNALAVS
jgi:hypothetical protein